MSIAKSLTDTDSKSRAAFAVQAIVQPLIAAARGGGLAHAESVQYVPADNVGRAAMQRVSDGGLKIDMCEQQPKIGYWKIKVTVPKTT